MSAASGIVVIHPSKDDFIQVLRELQGRLVTTLSVPQLGEEAVVSVEDGNRVYGLGRVVMCKFLHPAHNREFVIQTDQMWRATSLLDRSETLHVVLAEGVLPPRA